MCGHAQTCLISHLLSAIYFVVRFEPDHLLQVIRSSVETVIEDAEYSTVFLSEFHFKINNNKLLQ